MSRSANNVVIQNLTSGVEKTMDVSRLTPFIGADSLSKNQAIAAADLGETAVTSIIGVRGDPKVRKSLTFQVLWTDGEETGNPGRVSNA